MKIIQIVAFRDFLLALDDLGRVWRFDMLPPTWTLLSTGPPAVA